VGKESPGNGQGKSLGFLQESWRRREIAGNPQSFPKFGTPLVKSCGLEKEKLTGAPVDIPML
jgi:hypothetical protein